MSYIDLLKGDFKSTTRIFRLSAQKPIKVDNIPKLDTLCRDVHSLLKKTDDGQRFYMAVDISKFIIEPSLTKRYMEKIGGIMQQFLYPNGLARFGYQITRVTIQMGHTIDNSIQTFSERKKRQ